MASCETDGHLWGSIGTCVMCKALKPAETPSAETQAGALRAAEETTEPQLSDFLAKWGKIFVLPSEQEHLARLEHSHALQLWLRAKVASLTAACREKDERIDDASDQIRQYNEIIAKLRDRVRELEVLREQVAHINEDQEVSNCIVEAKRLHQPSDGSDAT